MPTRRVDVDAHGRRAEQHVFRDFENISLADKHTQRRSYRAGEQDSFSEPRYDTADWGTGKPGRTATYRNPHPEPSYYGPHFEKGPAQEKLWDDRKCKEVWDPRQPMRSAAARPETYGRAHSVHQSRMDQHQLSEPYQKRPMPYKSRTAADYQAYKVPSESHGAIGAEMKRYKETNVGRKHYPEDSHREDLLKAKELSKAGRCMANL